MLGLYKELKVVWKWTNLFEINTIKSFKIYMLDYYYLWSWIVSLFSISAKSSYLLIAMVMFMNKRWADTINDEGTFPEEIILLVLKHCVRKNIKVLISQQLTRGKKRKLPKNSIRNLGTYGVSRTSTFRVRILMKS